MKNPLDPRYLDGQADGRRDAALEEDPEIKGFVESPAMDEGEKLYTLGYASGWNYELLSRLPKERSHGR
jgi:hypothetical protein